MAFIVKSGCHYAKAIDGKPCYRSTWEQSEAARFETEAEAREWAPNVFHKSMLEAVEIVEIGGKKSSVATSPTPEKNESSSTWTAPSVNPNLERAIREGRNWTSREDADEVLFGIH